MGLITPPACPVSALPVDPGPCRARRSGGGRKALIEVDLGLLDALGALVEPETRGDPMARLRRTTKSTRTLAAELGRQGQRLSHHSVGRLLTGPLGYSLQGNGKTVDHRGCGRFERLPPATVETGVGCPCRGHRSGIIVCHMPPGASKWKRIEHRLFSHISMNWAGQPLTSHQVAVNLIATTTTRTPTISVRITVHEFEVRP